MTTFTTASTTSEPLTVDAIREAIAHIQALGEGPIRRYMRDKGFDPENGGMLVLPESMRNQFGQFGAPRYVKFSAIVQNGLMFIDPLYPSPHDISRGVE